MKRWLVLAVFAFTCTTQTVYVDGRNLVCTTCCDSHTGLCQTTCL